MPIKQAVQPPSSASDPATSPDVPDAPANHREGPSPAECYLEGLDEQPPPLTSLEPDAPLEPDARPTPLASEPQALAVPPPPRLPTPAMLWRDALLDLFAALGIPAVVIVVAAVVAGLAWAVLAGPGQSPNPALTQWGIAGALLATQIPLLFFALRRLRRNRQKGRPKLELFAGDWRKAVGIGLVTGLGLQAGAAVYANLVQRLMGDSASLDDQMQLITQIQENVPALAVVVFAIAVMAPLCEELFFRAAIFGSGYVAQQPRTAAAISAILFGTVHLSLPLFPYYAAFGLVMCWLFVRTRTLVGPIAAHFAMNASACLVLLFLDDMKV